MISAAQVEILDHTARRAAGGLYCGDSPDMQALVAVGMMKSAGYKPFVPDEYFCITEKGREALQRVDKEKKA